MTRNSKNSLLILFVGSRSIFYYIIVRVCSTTKTYICTNKYLFVFPQKNKTKQKQTNKQQQQQQQQNKQKKQKKTKKKQQQQETNNKPTTK